MFFLVGCSDNRSTTNQVLLTKNDIQHVIVLMLENRSYDNLLAAYQADSKQQFHAAKYPISRSGNHFESNGVVLSNTYLDKTYYLTDVSAKKVTPVPAYDPGEHFFNISNQIYDPDSAWTQNTKPTVYFPIDKENMGGFVIDYMQENGQKNPSGEPQDVMSVFTQSHVPVTYQLAKKFAVSDDWFASTPTQTYPNRSFLNSATAYGQVDNAGLENKVSELIAPTVYTSLAGSFHLYYESFSINVFLSQELWLPENQPNISPAVQFEKDVASGNLAQFVLYEPQYFGSSGNSGHPNQNIGNSENLIAEIYNILIQHPDIWNHTLFIITYDEHGGMFDHVLPPTAIAPEGKEQLVDEKYQFGFDRLGVRVPTLLVSPFVKQGSLIEAPEGQHFDHTSIIRTVFDLYGCRKKAKHSDGCYLTERDRNAPSLLPSLQVASNNLKYLPLSKIENIQRITPGIEENGDSKKFYCHHMAMLKLKFPAQFAHLPKSITSYFSHCKKDTV